MWMKGAHPLSTPTLSLLLWFSLNFVSNGAKSFWNRATTYVPRPESLHVSLFGYMLWYLFIVT